MLNITGIVMMIVGVLMMAGSAGDCDGKCMEYANTMGEMATMLILGLTIAAIGGIIVYNENKIQERDVRKYIKIGTKCDTKFGLSKVTGIEMCETEGAKEGIPMEKVFLSDKNRCVFDFENGHWQYGYQVEAQNA